jgi:hypothetical protein
MPLDSQQVEIIGRNWLVNELVHAGYEIAIPLRDAGVDLIVSPPDYAWSQPLQLKTSRDRAITVHSKYVGRPVLLAFTLLGDGLGSLPASPEAVYLRTGTDYSSRLLLMTPAEAWHLPTLSGAADADPESHTHHRLSWTALLKNGHLRVSEVQHRAQLPAALDAARTRLTIGLAALPSSTQTP